MTEDEAKTKKCCGPKVLISPIFVASGRPPSDPLAPLKCIGSECMAWRWDKDAPTIRLKASDIVGPRDLLVTPAVYAKDYSCCDFEGLPGEGFCGLAGKP